jgi:hypothetical protein
VCNTACAPRGKDGRKASQERQRIRNAATQASRSEAKDVLQQASSFQDEDKTQQPSSKELIMAGAVGKVLNRSGFASFVVKDWQSWMTEAVILHASGMSVPELRVKFGRTDHHIRNILNTEQAKEIVRKIEAQSVKNIAQNSSAKVAFIKDAALSSMQEMLSNETLKEKSPFAFWDAARKTLDTVSRMSAPAPAAPAPAPTVNIQQNIVSASPAMLTQLRSAPSLSSLEVPDNVEYLGSPPPAGKAEEPVLGSGVHGPQNQSKNGLALLNARSSPSSE